jgi:hypothetical protein
LRFSRNAGLPVDLDRTTYFVGRETLIPHGTVGQSRLILFGPRAGDLRAGIVVQTVLGTDCQADGVVVVVATDNCDNVTTFRSLGTISLRQDPPCTTPIVLASPQARPGNEVRVPSPDQRPTTWVSQLDVPGGRCQIVLNGSEALFPAAGRVPLLARPRSGDNRVEAQLVQAEGRAGLWRFELPAGSTVAGSLRVIAGQVALVTGDAVVFRLNGQPGERVVFTFRNR